MDLGQRLVNRQDCRFAQPRGAPKGCGTPMYRMNSMGSSTTWVVPRADGAQRQGRASGVGTGDDSVANGSVEELLETVVGFEVERGVLVVTDQQSLPFEGEGDTGGDGVEQALEFGLGRCGDAVETVRCRAKRSPTAPGARRSLRLCNTEPARLRTRGPT